MDGGRGTRGLTAHYFFTFGVDVQLVGARGAAARAPEPRVLHLDAAAAALKLVQKGSVRLFLRFDAVSQVAYDAAEPRSVLVSARDGARRLVDFQTAEDCAVFRAACRDVGALGRADAARYQRGVVRKGALLKRGRAGTFSERYAILTPRKLFVLPSKVSVYPSNVLSLADASPRFDDARGSIHLEARC